MGGDGRRDRGRAPPSPPPAPHRVLAASWQRPACRAVSLAAPPAGLTNQRRGRSRRGTALPARRGAVRGWPRGVSRGCPGVSPGVSPLLRPRSSSLAAFPLPQASGAGRREGRAAALAAASGAGGGRRRGKSAVFGEIMSVAPGQPSSYAPHHRESPPWEPGGRSLLPGEVQLSFLPSCSLGGSGHGAGITRCGAGKSGSNPPRLFASVLGVRNKPNPCPGSSETSRMFCYEVGCSFCYSR